MRSPRHHKIQTRTLAPKQGVPLSALMQLHSRWQNVQLSFRRACRIASHERQTNDSNGCHAKADILVRAPMTGCGVKTAPEVSSHFSFAPGGNVYPSECGGPKCGNKYSALMAPCHMGPPLSLSLSLSLSSSPSLSLSMSLSLSQSMSLCFSVTFLDFTKLRVRFVLCLYVSDIFLDR